MRPDLKRGARVLVSYGCVQIMRAVGKFAISGRIHSRRHARRGWYEVDLGWDIDMQAPRLVSVHHSALTAL